MIDETFSASVQYNDFTGTAAADMSDQLGPRKLLQSKGLLGDSEFVVGISVYTGENYGKFQDPIGVEFLIADGSHDSVKANIAGGAPLSVRSESIDMAVADLLGLFKRFSVVLSPHGMLNGRGFTRIER